MAPVRVDFDLELAGTESLWLSTAPDRRQSLPERRNDASREQLLHRVRAEFEELRGLRLTLAQARRLLGVREDVCVRILNTLIRDGLLRITPEHLYARRRIDA